MMKSIILIIMVFAFGKCASSKHSEEDLLGNDVRLFENTPVWEIAQAIEKGDTVKLKQLLSQSSKEVINYQEKKFGQSLLIWSIYSNHLTGFKLLLEAGADINLKANDSTKAINWAANVYETSDYLRLLLKHNPDVNYVANNKNAERLRTPLIAAAWYSLENTKLLVNNGADVNYYYSEDGSNNSPLYSAFRGGKVDIIHYLLLDAHANPHKALEVKLNGDSVYAVNMLRTLTFELGSEEYKKKMEIVEFLKKQGIDYSKAPIPKHYHTLYDKTYLEKY